MILKIKKLKILSGASVLLFSISSVSTVVQAGPVRPNLKSIVFKMVGGSQVKPYDLSSRQRTLWGSSSSNINPDDGERPSTSRAAIASSSSASASSSILIEGASSSTTIIEGSSSSSTSKLIQRDISKAFRSVLPETGEIKTRRNARPDELILGEAIYKMTHDREGKILEGGKGRPHIIVHTEPSKTRRNHTDVYIATMTKVSGKEKRLTDPHYHRLNTDDPAFSGSNATFVDLTSLAKITLYNSQKQGLLGKVITDDDLKFLRTRFGFEN